MSTPTGDNAFLHALELNVRTELTLAETTYGLNRGALVAAAWQHRFGPDR